MAITAEVLLIDKAYLVKYTGLNNAIDDNFVRASMYAAQDGPIEDALGSALLRKIKEDSVDASISGAYETLRDDYINKALAHWTHWHLLPMLYVKQDNGNLVKRISADTESVTLEEFNILREEVRKRALSYTDRMNKYISANRTSFAELNTTAEGDKNPNQDTYNMAFFGVTSGAKFQSDRLKDRYQ